MNKVHHSPPLHPFPPVEQADSQGLLAMGGRLSPEQVWLAHQSGIFPWYGEDSPILWWSPNPRGVIFCAELHISRSLQKTLRKQDYQLRFDHDFSQVIDCCAAVHGDSWITPEMKATYTALHQQGRAHSCELWQAERLVGGLYGVCLDKIFCGESMFSLIPNASKIVLAHLCAFLHEQGIILLDTQFITAHLQSMGAVEISRQEYLSYLGGNPDRLRGNWADYSPHLTSAKR